MTSAPSFLAGSSSAPLPPRARVPRRWRFPRHLAGRASDLGAAAGEAGGPPGGGDGQAHAGAPRQGHPLVRVPVAGADRAEGRGECPAAGEGRRRLRHRVGPPHAGAGGPRRDRRRAAAAGRLGGRQPRARGPRPARGPAPAGGPGPGHLRRQPPQPPRRADDDHGHPRAVAPPARRRRGGRLLLRHPGHGHGLGPRARRHPDRPVARQPALGRPGRRPDRARAGAC